MIKRDYSPSDYNPGIRLNLLNWWLRSAGNNSNNAANVKTDGSVNTNGYNVNNTNICVRPHRAILPEIVGRVLYPRIAQRNRIPSWL